MINLKSNFRFFKALTALILCLCLCGCGNLYDKEYVYETEYVMQSDSTVNQESVKVKNLTELTSEIGKLVSAGRESGSVVFSENYSGEPSADMASACWEVRTQDALCAYCVDNISYELSKIVSYYEADIKVFYSDKGVPFSEIIKLQYSFSLGDVIRSTIKSGAGRSAVLINSSVLTASDVEELVLETYKSDPIISPCAPKATVSLFHGSNLQKLYEIRISYSLAPKELERQREEMEALRPFSTAQKKLEDYKRLQLVMDYFNDVILDTEEGRNSVYNALIEKNADSEGISLGFVALCNLIGLEAKTVEGQYSFSPHFWNLVKINGDWYHVDAALYIQLTAEGQPPEIAGMPMTDTEAWGSYRWDTSAYPACSGILEID